MIKNRTDDLPDLQELVCGDEIIIEVYDEQRMCNRFRFWYKDSAGRVFMTVAYTPQEARISRDKWILLNKPLRVTEK